jgi:hypothetical protein
VRNPLDVLLAAENGVENVVSFFADIPRKTWRLWLRSVTKSAATRLSCSSSTYVLEESGKWGTLKLLDFQLCSSKFLDLQGRLPSAGLTFSSPSAR